ncbi:MAG: NAD(P)H-dependent oxidoreductase subunit E [Chloroflexi bacterium]|nr:NAD(P)H-dependent oxidoreductase subunit E [Chloroflexota bacterium]
MAVPAMDLAPLDRILEDFKDQKGAVIPILQRAQEAFGYLPREALLAISKGTGISASRLYGVATFYAQFRLTRRGRHLVKVCDGTACHVRGAAKIVEGIEEALNVKPGGSDPDFKYSMEIVYCLGSCGLAPIAVVDDKVYGQTESAALIEQLQKLE